MMAYVLQYGMQLYNVYVLFLLDAVGHSLKH